MLKKRRRLFRHLPEITFCLFSLRKKNRCNNFSKATDVLRYFLHQNQALTRQQSFALKCSILYGKSCHSIQCYEISKNQLVFKCIEKYTTTSAHTYNTDFNCHRKMDKAMLELFVLPQIASLCCSVWNFILLTKNLNIHWFQRSLKSL